MLVSILVPGVEQELRDRGFFHELHGAEGGDGWKVTCVEIHIPTERWGEFADTFKLVDDGWTLELRQPKRR